VTIPLMSGDWYSGPAGASKVAWLYAEQEAPQYMTKGLAESWDIPNPSTLICHIRKGIMWQDKPPVNGREVTADDIKWSWERLMNTATSGLAQIIRDQAGGKITWTAVDKYTLKCEYAKPDIRSMLTLLDWYRHTAREVIEKYGNQNDWKNVVGNGPFLLTDYVEGSSITYTSNPNYWEKDPQGRKLPYIDGFKILVITDASTRLAALRAGKIDVLPAVEWRDAEDIMKTNPEIKTTGEYASWEYDFEFMCDTTPFSDVRVRQALMMAVDRLSIVSDYHKGHASIIPSGMVHPGHAMYQPLEQRPATTQELFTYNPDKAKQLLTEAGFPSGFKTTIFLISQDEPMASMIKACWEKVGVSAELKVLEPAAFTAQQYTRAFPKGTSFLWRWSYSWGNWSWVWQPGASWNFCRITDQKLTDLFYEANQNYVDWNKWVKDWKAIDSYTVDQAYENVLPGTNVRTFWQPWVKGYHGETYLGRTGYYLYPTYIWLEK
jgi:peptide/nickel transport system substrate-binding protein